MDRRTLLCGLLALTAGVPLVACGAGAPTRRPGVGSARAGDRVQFRVFGLAPSENACLQVKGDFVRVKGKKSGEQIVRKLQLPTGNQRRVGLVKTSDDEARTSILVRN